MDPLERFIIEAKEMAYVGGKPHETVVTRPGAHEIRYEKGPYRYLDSYFGGTDFLGQELVWKKDEPIWAMNYYGRIVDPDRLDGERAGLVIKHALTALYQEKRFLGGFSYIHPLGEYLDDAAGDYRSFIGTERILVAGRLAYRLDYQGGLIKP